MSMFNKSSINAFPNMGRVGQGSSYGTFGELLQGVLEEDNLDFLVTLPITRTSNATFYSISSYNDVVVLPFSKQKSKKLVGNILQYFDFPLGGILEINSNLPVGKGLASSSADLVAASRALEDCFNIKIERTLLEYFLSGIEPTDGVMYDGAVSFYHREVRLKEYIGKLPHFCILSIDEGGTIDTVEFNKQIKPFNHADKLEYNLLLQRLSKAIKEKDANAIGLVSSRSAVLNQKILPKEFLPELININQKISGLGVVVAHSGTSLGILLLKEELEFNTKLELGYKYLSELNKDIYIYHT